MNRLFGLALLLVVLAGSTACSYFVNVPRELAEAHALKGESGGAEIISSYHRENDGVTIVLLCREGVIVEVIISGNVAQPVRRQGKADLGFCGAGANLRNRYEQFVKDYSNRYAKERYEWQKERLDKAIAAMTALEEAIK